MKPIYHMLLTLGFLSLTACSMEYGFEEKNEPTGRTIEFTLSNLPTVAGTRAAEDLVANEGVINKLDVFFFDTSGNCLFYPDAMQLNMTGTSVTITIPETTYVGTLQGKQCTVFLMANSPLERSAMTGKTLEQLKNIDIENTGTRLFNTATSPADFLMTGQVDGVNIASNTLTQGLGHILLKRTAAKVVVNITNASVPNSVYIATNVRAHMYNYLDLGKVGYDLKYDATAGSEDYKNGEQTMTRNGTSFTMDVGNAFYTYPNDWNDDPDKETHITLEIDWRNQDDNNDVRTYYYRIPFSAIRASQGAGDHNKKIRSNFVYEFMVQVSDFGGVDPEHAVDIAANFDILDWSTGEVAVELLEYHYLFVYNPDMRTYNTTYEWEYRSSLPADITVKRGRCRVYTPESGTGTLPSGRDVDYPLTDIEISHRNAGERTFFSVEDGWIPNNYVPLIIEVELKNNAANMTAHATLSILPGEYVVASTSLGDDKGNYPRAGSYAHPIDNTGNNQYGSNNGYTTETDINFFQVNTTSLPDREIRIGNTMQKIMIGDPTMPSVGPTGTWTHLNGYEYIETDPNKNHIVSPSFVVASRRGATTSDFGYNNSWERCRRYRESQYPAGTWRVPTFAELAMLGDMQNDDQSAVKNLFISASSTGNGWWTALSAYSIRADQYRYSTGTTGVYQPTGAAVRCVRDTWKVYDQDDYAPYYP